MTWLNEFEVKDAARQFADHPVMAEPTAVLERFMDWVNENSDGWPYWQAASAASRKLQVLIYLAHQTYRTTGEIGGCTLREARRSYTSIKRLLNKHGADPTAVLFR